MGDRGWKLLGGNDLEISSQAANNFQDSSTENATENRLCVLRASVVKLAGLMILSRHDSVETVNVFRAFGAAAPLL